MPRTGPRSGPMLLTAGLFAFVGCANILGIDNEYVLENSQESSGGTTASGGETAETGGESAGGAASTGGVGVHTGGTAATGGAGDAGPECSEDADCDSGEKCCGGACVTPAPIVGCGLTGCERCAEPPSNAVPICATHACSIQCVAGYEISVTDGKSCVPQTTNTGGSTGAGGKNSGGATSATGGTASVMCDPKTCNSACGPAGPFSCCRVDNKCGCTWAPGAACY